MSNSQFKLKYILFNTINLTLSNFIIFIVKVFAGTPLTHDKCSLETQRQVFIRFHHPFWSCTKSSNHDLSISRNDFIFLISLIVFILVVSMLQYQSLCSFLSFYKFLSLLSWIVFSITSGGGRGLPFCHYDVSLPFT